MEKVINVLFKVIGVTFIIGSILLFTGLLEAKQFTEGLAFLTLGIIASFSTITISGKDAE